MLLRAGLVDPFDDDGRRGQRPLHIALLDPQVLEDVVGAVLDLVRARRHAEVERRGLGRDVDRHRQGRAAQRDTIAVREQQHRLVHVAHVSRREHRLVALDQQDLVGPGEVLAVDHDELRPVDALPEPHRGDATARRGAADGGAPEKVVQGQVVHVALASGELGETFAAVHRRRM